MRRSNRLAIIILLVLIVVGISILIGVKSFNHPDNGPVGVIPDSVLFNAAPVLSPEEALLTFQLEDGFSIELVASEPLIQDPVAMDFDEKGRLWVVEMQSYMPNLEGSGEDTPSGRIVILDDRDGDGRMDTSKVFLDSLVLPRAISIASNGVLFSEPPRLWFVENNEDRPGRKMLVDSAYAAGGNVEHQPNGLMRGMDNWHYNAKSRARYQYRDGQWIRDQTEFRGQWGISRDNYGRLFYNTNFNQLRGDLYPPNMLIRNSRLNAGEGINREIVKDQRVYPIRPTPGINRGYQDDMLDEQMRLTSFTAACGPVIYRGDQFPNAYLENAFVCEPAGNLVKRNILTREGMYVEGIQAYQDREFLASTDERFRPVNLYNAPDGSLYLVDMYRGIIQHETFLTEYLRDQIRSRNLQKPLGLGRIYRIKYEGNWFNQFVQQWKTAPQAALHNASDEELVAHLSHRNGWWRDMAQQLLVERNNPEMVSHLGRVLQKDNSLGKMHALWTLEGMGIYHPEVLTPAFRDRDPEVVATAIRVADRNAGTTHTPAIMALYAEMVDHDDPLVQMQLALSLGEFTGSNSGKSEDLLHKVVLKSKEDPLMTEAFLSSMGGKEMELLSFVKREQPEKENMIAFLEEFVENAALEATFEEKDLSEKEQKDFLLGKTLYAKTCAACHGEDGEGVVPIAPPLNKSEWVTGPQERLILITLHGLTGPVTVRGKEYKVPEVQPVMPGLKDNPEFTDKNIAALLTFVRNAWANEADALHSTEVKKIREAAQAREEPFTAAELELQVEQE